MFFRKKSIVSPENKALASKFRNIHRNSKISESNISVSRHSTQRISKVLKNSELADNVHRISVIDESNIKIHNNDGKRLTLTVPDQNFLFNSAKRKSEIKVEESRGSETPSINEFRSRNNQ